MSTSTSSNDNNSNDDGGGGGGGVKAKQNLVVDPFCFRQFAENREASVSYGGTVFSIPMSEFESVVNSRFDPKLLKDGYAPFCKHLFVLNDFTDARVNALAVTESNAHMLRTKYEARNERELPVLTRYFPRESICPDPETDELPVAKYLDLILYSREQIENEDEAMGKGNGKPGRELMRDSPWGIVSIKAQDVDRELPMTPITAMRNALGKEEGGSGIPVDRESYMDAYEYWKDHANVSS